MGDINLPKSPTYTGNCYLIPKEVFEILNYLDSSDALIVYLTVFVEREYRMAHVHQKRVSIDDVARELMWDNERVAVALDYLEEKDVITFVSEKPEFALKNKVNVVKLERQVNVTHFDDEDKRKGIPLEEMEDQYYNLKKKVISVIAKHAPMKLNWGKEFGILRGYVKRVKPENVERYLNDMIVCIESEAQKGQPKYSVAYFKPEVVLSMIQKMNKSANPKRGAVFNFELKDFLKKKISNCYRSHDMDKDKNPESEMKQKAFDAVKQMIERKSLYISDDEIWKEINSEWNLMRT